MASELTQNILWHGVDETPQEPVWLLAGPLRAALDEGQLRGIYLKDAEIVRRIYGAVRDRYWNTVPGVISGLAIDRRDDGFRVTFTSEHVSAEVDFLWRAEIIAASDGTLTYTFEGEARKPMFKNRIGLCVLIPQWVNRHGALAEYVSGDQAEVKFPDLVDPKQPVVGLHDFRGLRFLTGWDIAVQLGFEGDVFEIEDQRNWTDASYKIYSTPQRIPMPAKMEAGQRVRQTVTLKLSGPAQGPAKLPEPVTNPGIVLGDETSGTLPALGVGVAYHGEPLSEKETARLKALGLSHYRVEIDAASPGYQSALEKGLQQAEAMGTKAEVVLLVDGEVEDQARNAAQVAVEYPGLVARWLILTRGAPATRDASLIEARDLLAEDGTPVGAGTDADFFQLNNNRPPDQLCDFISVPLRPCAHQFDRLNMIQNLEGQREVLRTIDSLWPEKPKVVSPVSFRTRAQKGPVAAPGEMPAQADVRQMSLFGAAWTLGCIKVMAESGVKSATLFQTTGLRGIMERESGSAAPGTFHSIPGGVFPMYFVFAALTGWTGASVAETASSVPDIVESLLLVKDGRSRLLLANYSAKEYSVPLTKGGAPLKINRAVVLDAETATAFMNDPENWLASPPVRQTDGGTILLPPFAIAWLDL